MQHSAGLMARFTMLAALLAVVSALTNGPFKVVQQKMKLMKPIELSKLPAAASALSISLYTQVTEPSGGRREAVAGQPHFVGTW